jgi:hypothetical protein
LFAVVLSLGLGLFLTDAFLSLADDSLALCFESHFLRVFRGSVGVFAMLLALVIYGLMGLTPLIPKRLFLPLTLYYPVAQLLILPVFIYGSGHIQLALCGLSLSQVMVGLWILHRVRGGFRVRWPLLTESQLVGRRFSWLNLWAFLLVNGLLLLPAALAYVALCTSLAVAHFSEGFVALRTEGLVVQERKYVRDDGKVIQLIPMSHIGEPDFYQKLAGSFPTNSIILMEGVTDDRSLLTNKLTYERTAASLGVAEQQKVFRPRGHRVRADVDIAQFATNTIDFLNLVTLVHVNGLKPQTVLELMRYSPPPHFEDQLLEDLLRKRNRQVVAEIQARLPQAEHFTVPWGAAHMPGIAQEIQKLGFHLVETRDHVAIRFGSAGKQIRSVGHEAESEKPR